jgi:nucleotide-binding universal stress UspA family protein
VDDVVWSAGERRQGNEGDVADEARAKQKVRAKRRQQRGAPTDEAAAATIDVTGTARPGAARTQRSTATAVALRPFPGPFSFKCFLAPLDGSFYAERALPYATKLARLTGAGMILGYVQQPTLPAPAQLARQLAQDLVGHEPEPCATDAAAYLDAQRVVQAFHAPEVRAQTIEDGDAVFGLRQLAERGQADTIVLATHARQGIERQVLGSTVDGLVEQSHLPLLIIPPRAVVPAGAPSLKHVLVPLDCSPVAEYALGVLLGLMQATARPPAPLGETASWQIALITVVDSQALKADARAYVSEVEARLRAAAPPRGVWISKRVLLGSAPDALVAVADHGMPSSDVISVPFDLVVMATHGRGGLGAWLYGSVARYVLPRVTVPILLVHPPDGSIT